MFKLPDTALFFRQVKVCGIEAENIRSAGIGSVEVFGSGSTGQVRNEYEKAVGWNRAMIRNIVPRGFRNS